MDKNELSFKEQIEFEKMVYSNFPHFEYVEIENKSFLIHLFGKFPKIRPHYLDQIVSLCILYLNDKKFKDLLIQNILYICPTLAHRLFKRGAYSSDEIKQILEIKNHAFSYLFFINEIENLAPVVQKDSLIYNNYKDNQELPLLILNGFHPQSIEYCLKNDLVDIMITKANIKSTNNQCEWSPFEWSNRPVSMDFLSFSCFYGSLKCFRYLMLNGYALTESVHRCLLCSGSLDSFQIFNVKIQKHYCKEAAEYCQYHILKMFINSDSNYRTEIGPSFESAIKNNNLSVIDFLIDQGIDINSVSFFRVPLSYASQYGNIRMVSYLIQKGSKIHFDDRKDEQPIHLAAILGHYKIVEYLIKQGANVNTNEIFLIII